MPVLVLLAYAASCAHDAARLSAQAQFFEELFGGGRGRPSDGAQKRDDDDLPAKRRRRKSDAARDFRYRTGRPFFQIARIGDNFRPIETIELRWNRGAPYKMRLSYAQPAIIALNYAGSFSNAPRLMCVRACDGAVISLAKYDVGDVARQHPSCESACPGAETRLYRLPAGADEMSAAVDVGSKTTYAELLERIGASTSRKNGCFCGSIVARNTVGVESFLRDPTLRYGDIVATSGGLKMFRGFARPTHRANEFAVYSGPLGSLGGRIGTLAAINHMLKTPEPHGFSATIQFGPK